MKIGIEDIKYMIRESISRILESYHDDGIVVPEDLWGYKEPTEEEIRKEKIENYEFNALVLVDDSDGAILANYTIPSEKEFNEIFSEAVNDAKQKKLQNKFGTYYVYGCLDNEYDDDTILFDSDQIEE